MDRLQACVSGHRWWCSVALVVLCRFAPVEAKADVPPKATLVVSDIYQAATAAHDKIKNLRVRYEVNFKQLLNLPSYSTNNIALATEPRLVEFAMDGERRRFLHMPLGPTDAYVANGPARTVIFDGGRSIQYGDDDMAEIFPGKAKHADDLELYTTMVLGIPVTDRDRVQHDAAWNYPHCLREAPGGHRYVVRPDLESVDGVWCHVVEAKGYDTLWIDVKLGYGFRRREQYFGPETEALMHVDTTSEFIEAFPGVWIPRRFRRQHFAGPSNPPEYYNKVHLETNIHVLEIAINDLTDDDFSAKLKAGRYVADHINGNVYQVPGNELDAFHDLAATGERYVVDIIDSHSPPRRVLGMSRQALWVLGFNLALIGIVYAVLRWQRRRGQG